MEAPDTGDNFGAILGDIIDLDDALEGTVLLEGLGVDDINLEFNRGIEGGALGGLVPQFDEEGLPVVRPYLGVGFDFKGGYYEEIFLSHLLLFLAHIYTKVLNQIILVSSVTPPRSLGRPSHILTSFQLVTPPGLLHILFRTFLVLFQGRADLRAVIVGLWVGMGVRAGRCGSWSIPLNRSF